LWRIPRKSCSPASASSAVSTTKANRLNPKKAPPEDDVAQFIARIERNDKAFQRSLSRSKVKSIRNFYETAITQPPIPGTVLLLHGPKAALPALDGDQTVGHLQQPEEKFLIIDGQHRLAALNFYERTHPDEAKSIFVPCVIFDGRSDDFATEMFVIINSTPTRINKSHLVDLYERVSWAEPDRRFAARIVEQLYSESDSPLRYRINRLGGRSKQEKWILQAELFNENPSLGQTGLGRHPARRRRQPPRCRYYAQVRDFLKSASQVFEDAWGNDNYMVTNPSPSKP